MKKLFSAILALVMVLSMSAVAFAAGATVAVKDLNKVPECDTTTKYLEDYNLAVFKKGGNFVIWIEDALTAEQQTALVAEIEAAGIDDLANLHNPAFACGFTTFELIDQDVTITTEGTINFEGKSTWSWFYRGNYTLATLEWVKTGEDSATGYDPAGRISKSPWFMANTIDAAGMAVRDSVTIDIQAGEYKNGTNFVGTLTVTKVAENQFVASYDVKALDATHKIVLDGAKLWINDTGKFVTSPGNQKGLATAVKADTAFTFEGETLYLFAHFNASYWELMEVVAE